MSETTDATLADYRASKQAQQQQEATFARLKKEVLYHEKRMHLLLSTRIVEDFGFSLVEKSQVRSECATDCRNALTALNAGAAEARLSGRWDDAAVAALFRLDVPLREVVGSSRFEAPPAADRETLKQLVLRLHAQSEHHQEFRHERSGELAQQLAGLLDATELSKRDVRRMREAVSAKLQVMGELDELARALLESGFGLAKERVALDELKRQESMAAEEGEASLTEDALRARIAVTERMIDIIFYRAHTVDQTVDTNVTKQQANLRTFQTAAAALEGIKKEKRELIEGCGTDMQRIERGIAFQQSTKESASGKTAAAIEESMRRLAALDARRDTLSARMLELFAELAETEGALHQASEERAQAVAAHVELVENGRHATADFTEMARFADTYRTNLDRTQQQHQAVLNSVELLEALLLQEQDYLTYDFRASAKRLQAMRRGMGAELNRALNELESATTELIRRKEAAATQLQSKMEVAGWEAELRADILDPSAKRYVMQLRQHEREREILINEVDELRDKLAQHRTTCFGKIAESASDDRQIVTVEAEAEERDRRQRERLLQHRQALAERDLQALAAGVTAPVGGATAEEERSLLEVHLQSLPPTQQEQLRTLRNAETQRAMIAAAAAAEAAPGDSVVTMSSGVDTSTATNGGRRAGRVAAVRDEIRRAKAPAPADASVSTTTTATQLRAALQAELDATLAGADPVAAFMERRRLQQKDQQAPEGGGAAQRPDDDSFTPSGVDQSLSGRQHEQPAARKPRVIGAPS
jgi:hypothetical protein